MRRRRPDRKRLFPPLDHDSGMDTDNTDERGTTRIRNRKLSHRHPILSGLTGDDRRQPVWPPGLSAPRSVVRLPSPVASRARSNDAERLATRFARLSEP